MVLSPKKLANDITRFLDECYSKNPDNRFPVDVISVAKVWSQIKFPKEPILNILPLNIECEGVLDRTGGWNIFYSTKVNCGRQRFTIAHELGHYLLHRHELQDGISCNYSAMNDWGTDENNRENQANTFASWLLMPTNDYRKQIETKPKNLETFFNLSNRYGTSLTSTILKFLEITPERAILVCIKDGFVLWARSSEKALITKKFIKASNSAIEVPKDSLAAKQEQNLLGVHKESGGWFDNVEYDEMNFPYGGVYNLTLLILDLHDKPKEPERAFIRISGGKRSIL